MTDRHKGYVVVLERDIREDDAAALRVALKAIRGVVAVDPIVNEPGAADLARMRRDEEWREALSRLAIEGPPNVVRE